MTKRIRMPEAEESPPALRSLPRILAESWAAILVALLPLKFTEMISVPEMPPAFRTDFWSLLTAPFPTVFFSMAAISLLVLALAAFLLHRGPFEARPLLYGLLWIPLAAASLLGLRNASCQEYAVQAIAYVLPLTGCVASLCILTAMRSGFRRILRGALLFAVFLAVFSGFDQWLHQFDLMEAYLNEPGRAEAIQGTLRSRALERRIFGLFNVANTFAGWLAAMLPLALAALWRFGNERVSPPKLSRRVLTCIGLAAIGFLLVRTESRGAFFALIAASALTAMAIPASRRTRTVVIAGLLLCIGLFVLAVTAGRGPLSMLVRLDYFQAAFRMMTREPLFGSGWGDFFHDYFRLRLWEDSEGSHSPHNFLLFFGAQCGVVGFLAAFAVWLFPVWNALRAARRLRWNDAAGFRAFAASFAVLTLSLDLLLEIGIETPASATTLAVLALLAQEESDSAPVRLFPAAPLWSKAAILTGGCAFAFVSIVLVHKEFRSEKAQSDLFYALDPAFSLEADFQPPPPDRVAVLLERTRRDAPHAPFPLAKAAGYCLAIGRADAAVSLLNEAERLSPENPALRLFRTQAMFQANGGRMTEEIRRELARVREAAPKNPDWKRCDEELVRIEALEEMER